MRETFDLMEEHIPLARTEIASGTKVFDWFVPDEWNIREAYIAAPDGTRVVDFERLNLHVVCYSEPVAGQSRSRRSASGCTRCPISPTWFRTEPPTTTARGDSASPTASSRSWSPVTTRW